MITYCTTELPTAQGRGADTLWIYSSAAGRMAFLVFVDVHHNNTISENGFD